MLLKSKLPAYLIRIIANFLSERSIKVKVGNDYSHDVSLSAGTPQGGGGG